MTQDHFMSDGQTVPPRPPLGLSGLDPDLLGDSANDAPDEWGRIPAAAVPPPTRRASTEATSDVADRALPVSETSAFAHQQPRVDAAADECFARPAVAELTMPMATYVQVVCERVVVAAD